MKINRKRLEEIVNEEVANLILETSIKEAQQVQDMPEYAVRAFLQRLKEEYEIAMEAFDNDEAEYREVDTLQILLKDFQTLMQNPVQPLEENMDAASASVDDEKWVSLTKKLLSKMSSDDALEYLVDKMKVRPRNAYELVAAAEQPLEEAEKKTKRINMKGRKCSQCKSGKYAETSPTDDMYLEFHCTKCGHRTDAWITK